MYTTHSTRKPYKGLNIALWIGQVFLAGMFIMAGIMKVSQPIDQLSQMLPWTAQIPEILVRFIGISEALGAVGLLLPALLRIKPVLTPIAATGLALVQLFAIAFHLSRGEAPAIVINIILLLVAVFIAWGRFKKVPVTTKPSHKSSITTS
jgi:putative oxidoreductase